MCGIPVSAYAFPMSMTDRTGDSESECVGIRSHPIPFFPSIREFLDTLPVYL